VKREEEEKKKKGKKELEKKETPGKGDERGASDEKLA
jgi:hypothetical protein